MPEENVNVINGSDPNGTRSRSDSTASAKTTSDAPPKARRFQNGWTKEQERLMADWADIAVCYRWLHDRSDKTFHVKTLGISLPVIFLSTLSGFANIGVQAILNSDEEKKYASFVIAGVSLMAGLLTTVGDRLRYAQLEEAHRVSAIAWGKFQRLIAVELALNPNDRMDSLDFLKICRADLDRLIEQSPPIPKESTQIFEKKFGKIADLKKPDICGALEHTNVYRSSESRLKQMAIEASLMLRRKKQTLNELVTPEIQNRIAEQVEQRMTELLEERKRKLQDELEMKRFEEMRTQEEIDKAVEERKKKIQEEIELEKKKLYQEPMGNSKSSDALSRIGATAAQFESRLNFRRSSLLPVPTPAPTRKTSIEHHSVNQTTSIAVNDAPAQPTNPENTIVIISK